jgi:hypothetical protein
MAQRSPHSASYTDVNGNHHYREFASERAANKWLWETMPARDVRLLDARWEREAKRAAKAHEREDARRRSAGEQTSSAHLSARQVAPVQRTGTGDAFGQESTSGGWVFWAVAIWAGLLIFGIVGWLLTALLPALLG